MRQKAERIAAGWDAYRDRVMDPLPETEIMACRRAYYAGAHCILMNILDIPNPEAVPTEEDILMIEDLQEELAAFATAVIEGRD